MEQADQETEIDQLADTWAVERHNDVPSSFPSGVTIAIRLKSLIYACHFVSKPGANCLMVSLHGSTGGARARPAIHSEGRGKRAGAHHLIISDPSLFLDADLHHGVFLGEKDKDPIEGVIRISTQLAASIHVPEHRIFFWGESGGGFAALMSAVRLGAGAVVGNSQTDLLAIQRLQSGSVIVNRFQAGSKADEMGAKFPARVNVTAAFKDARARGLAPRLAISQNRQDNHHFTRHYLPLCAALQAPPDGGVSSDGLIHTTVLDYSEGHHITTDMTASMMSSIAFALGER